MLVLFDIDATLISTMGVGARSLEGAGRRLHGPRFSLEGVEYAGRLDPTILAEALATNGVLATADGVAALRAGYRAALAQNLPSCTDKGALPGVMELVGRLEREAGVTLGLLTGNYEETGRLKLGACGLDTDRFAVRVWGDESERTPPLREHLPAVAMERFRLLTGRRIDPAQVVIIGDTPHDVRCAQVNGCRVLGVATGRSTVEDLERAGADRSVPDLRDAEGVVAWILAGRGGSVG